jgi:E3 ubiquitin-protein ligase HERC2
MADGYSNVAPQDQRALCCCQIKEVCCGETHTMCLTDDGKVFSWGLDIEGQLGHGTDAGHKPRPTQIGGVLSGVVVKKIACAVGPGGPGHSAAIDAEGNLYTWGIGKDGALGHGDTECRLEPTLVAGALAGVKCVSVSCGATHTAALTEDGVVFTWGGGESGQLGHGEKQRVLVATPVRGLLEHKKMSAVACGGYHTLALMRDASVWAWGEGLNGQLGVGGDEAVTTASMVAGLAASAIACGPHHSAAVTSDGRMVTWGYNKDGQLGHGDRESVPCPREVAGVKART